MLLKISEFLKRNKMPESTFGRLAIGDPRLVGDIKKGRQLRPVTAMRISTFMAFYDAERSA